MSYSLQKTHHKVITKKKYHKILYLYPAFNQTFVFLGMLGLRQDSVTHMDKEGNILFQYVFDKPMDSMGMLVQTEAIFLQTRKNCITILDLEKHQFRRYPFYFFNEQSDQAEILTFGETKMLCISQYGRYNDNRYMLTYYKYPPQVVHNVYKAKDDEWTHEYISKKANAHSMVCWFKARHDQYWMFKTYDLRDDPNGMFKTYKFPQQMGIPYNMAKLQIAMNTMWQMSKNVFMLVCISNKSDKEKNKQLDVIQNNFVCDTKTEKVRQANFALGWHHNYLIDQTYMGNTCMFRTFNFENGKPLPAPVFFIDNETEEIVAKEQWECSYLYKFQSPGYDPDMLIQNQYENGDCQWFQCSRIKMVYNWKIQMMHTAIALYPQFDEDLLHDVWQMTAQ